MKYKAAIFDMDGLLIDSEPFWLQAEIAAMANVGVTLTEEMCRETTGLRLDETIAYWEKRFLFDGKTNKELQKDILDVVAKLVQEKGTMLPGARETLHLMKETGCHVAIATCSAELLINTVVEKFDLFDVLDLTYSATHEKNGKPAPDVYLTTAKKLGVDPIECIVFEDSINGMLAAKAAGMACVSVPSVFDKDRQELAKADMVLSSLTEFSLEQL